MHDVLVGVSSLIMSVAQKPLDIATIGFRKSNLKNTLAPVSPKERNESGITKRQQQNNDLISHQSPGMIDQKVKIKRKVRCGWWNVDLCFSNVGH